MLLRQACWLSAFQQELLIEDIVEQVDEAMFLGLFSSTVEAELAESSEAAGAETVAFFC